MLSVRRREQSGFEISSKSDYTSMPLVGFCKERRWFGVKREVA